MHKILANKAQLRRRVKSRLATLVLPIIAVTAVWATNAQGPSVASSPADVIRALQAGHFDEALHLAQINLKRFPNDKRLWVLHGMALSGKGSDGEALASFKHALALDSHYLPGLEGAAQAAFKKEPLEAKPYLSAILSEHPGDTTSNAMMGFVEYRERDCKDSVASFDHAQAGSSTDVNLLGAYGYCLATLDRYQEAVSVFAKALGLDPRSQQVRLDLALVQWKGGHPQDGLATLQPMIEAEPPLPSAELLAAGILEASNDTSHAVELLRKVILQDPKNVEAYLDFAALAFDHASMEVGVDYLNAGLTQLPREPNLYIARGVLQSQIGHLPEAAEDFAKANALDPNLSFPRMAQGLVASEEHHSSEAIGNFRSAAMAHPDDALAQYLLADALSEQGDASNPAVYAEEVAAAQRAIQLDPRMAPAHDLLATAYMRNEQPEKAVRECRDALSTDPDDQQAVFHLILLLRKTEAKAEIPSLLKRLNELRAASPQGPQSKRYRLEEVPAQNGTVDSR